MRLLIIFLIFFAELALSNDTNRLEKKYKEGCRVVRVGMLFNADSVISKIADIDKCKEKIITNLYEKTLKINFKEEIENSKNKTTIPQGLIYKTVFDIFKILGDYGIDCKKSSECVAIAVDGIREARTNNKIFIEYIKEKIGMDIKIIPRTEEGRLGFSGIFAKGYLPEEDKKNILILDIREKDFKIFYLENEEIKSISFGVGPRDFKTSIIKRVKEKFVNNNSPNPMTEIEIDRAFEYTQNKIVIPMESIVIDPEYNKKIVNQNTKVFATGDLVKNIIMPVINDGGRKFDKVNIMNGITRLIGLKDEQIAARYSKISGNESNITTDLIFLYGIMRGMKIDSISVVDSVNDLEGLLVSNNYWKK